MVYVHYHAFLRLSAGEDLFDAFHWGMILLWSQNCHPRTDVCEESTELTTYGDGGPASSDINHPSTLTFRFIQQ